MLIETEVEEGGSRMAVEEVEVEVAVRDFAVQMKLICAVVRYSSVGLGLYLDFTGSGDAKTSK